MGYYYVLEVSPHTATCVIEDLETGKKISIERISHAVFEDGQ